MVDFGMFIEFFSFATISQDFYRYLQVAAVLHIFQLTVHFSSTN